MKFSKILIFIVIGCVAGLLLVYGVKLQAQNRPSRDAIMAKMGEMNIDMSRMEQFRNRQQGSNRVSRDSSNREESKENPDYYRTIVDNNIFRPLGWRPPNKEPEYAFVGTFVGKNGARSEASVRERRSGKFYMVTIGEKVGDAVVKEISEKKIILDKDGETITLQGGGMQFLKASGSSRSSSRSDNRDDSNDNNNNNSKSRDREAELRAKEAAAKKNAEERVQEMRRRFESASREQRARMISEFRSRGGFRGRRGGDR